MFNWKFFLRIASLAILAGMFIPAQINATHIVGGDLTFRCLGNNQYEIRLTVRRDCLLGAEDAPFDNPAGVGFYDAVTNQLIPIGGVGGFLPMMLNDNDTLNQIFISDCTIAGNEVCVEQTVYVDTVTLPFRPNGYLMAYQRCCRNGTLANIQNPLQTGMTLTAYLSPQEMIDCKNGPQFGPYPPIYICANEPFIFDHSATDDEGDSLVYDLCVPFAGGTEDFNMPQPPPNPPFDTVVWQPPYNLNNLLGGEPLTIDSQTGLITGTPNAVGQYIIGVCVTSYRDGEVVGFHHRDLQVNVRMCRDVPVADFDVESDLFCDTLTVGFTENAQFSDEYRWIFDFGNPDSDFSFELNPTYSFQEPGFYDVALIVNDADSICFDTLIQTIGVFESELTSDFAIDIPFCQDSIVITPVDLSSDPDYEVVSWDWILTCGLDIYVSTDQNPSFTLGSDPENCTLCLTVTDENGCTDMSCQTFDPGTIDLPFFSDSIFVCNGESTEIIAFVDTTLEFTWGSDPTLDLSNPINPVATPTTSTTYYVTVTDGFCTVIDSVFVGVQLKPDIDFNVFTDCRSLTITTENLSEGSSFLWDFGDPNTDDDISFEEEPTYTYDNPGVYSVTLLISDGCDTMASREITVNIVEEIADDVQLGCVNEPVFLNPDFNENYTYTWSPADLLEDPNAPNPQVTLDTETTFYVTITDTNLPGCSIEDSVTVSYPMVNITDMLEDTVVSCFLEPVPLNPDFDPDDSYAWSPADGLSAVNIGNPIATVTGTTMYYVTITDDMPPNCSITDSILVFVPDDFEIILAEDTAYCGVQTITVTAGATVEGVTYEWFDQDGNSIGTGASIDLSPSEVTSYMVTGTDPYGCSKDASITLMPTFFDLTYSSDEDICLGDEVELSVTNNDTNQELTYSWTPTTGILTNPDSSVIIVSPTETTTYTILVENGEVGCSEEMTIVVTVFNFDPLDVLITASTDSVIVGVDEVQLTVNQDPSWTYEWSSNPPDDIDNIYNPVVSPPSEGAYTYTVTVTNDGGCTAVASIGINAFDPPCDEEDIFLPNAFSPNGDGQNDVLFIRGNFVESVELRIYNRWGQEVFRTNDQAIGWDGTFNGELLTPDVFGYYLNVGCPGDKNYQTQGNITLFR